MLTLPVLTYNYDALEPVIDAATMQLHYEKHHQAYLDKFNAALEQEPSLKNKTAEELLANLAVVPEAVREAVKNHGGGHVNHSFFWQSLTPPGSAASVVPSALVDWLTTHFGGVEEFKIKFKTAGLNRFGSGWVWLVLKADQPQIISTANQDSPLSAGATPILGVDVWEHAYYLKYQNRRADYLEAIWQIINWPQVAARAKL